MSIHRRLTQSLATLATAVLFALCTTGLAAGEPISDQDAQFFESQVRPLLVEHCWSCHGPEQQKSDLRLDSLAAVLHGGESGPAIVPGKSDESLLAEAIRYESYEMPPKGQLAAEKIATLERWIDIGAPWPGASDTPVSQPPQDETISKQDAQFFESQVRPLLAEHCWDCHGAEQQKSDLRLDSLATMLHGGESGPAIVPGKPDESLLAEAIRYESYEMPPTGQLGAEDIATLVHWIEIGAPWPGAQGAPISQPPQDKFSAEDRAWWAFQPLLEPEIPAATNVGPPWSDHPIDAFILQRMSEAGLSPAPEADRTTLIRRLYFDLVGLPPTPQQVADFLADTSPQAYQRLVDELLSSPQYGQRWARHWLDLVRYADSDGYRIDHYRPDAWRYRDYVIQSFNDDKPYDRFVQEQIAGDELFPDEPQALVATGYLRHGIYEYNNRDVRGQWTTIMHDVTDTTGDVFLGLGMQCAKCHDHKFDPILQRDYFRLQAFFAPLLPHDAVVAGDQQRQDFQQQQEVWEEATADLRKQIEDIESRYRQLAADEAIGRFPADIQAMIGKPADQRTPREHQLAELAYRQVLFEYSRLDTKFNADDKERVLALRKELAGFDKLRPVPLPVAMTVCDVGPQAPPTVIPKRGDEPIEPGFLTLLDEASAAIEPIAGLSTTGRRAALARWLTRPDNPLSTRVIVNRVWQYHFGRGLAPNSSDFGRLGGQPSHPELLDWLTAQFVRDGWSLKKLHRQIVTSATYRQATSHPRFAEYQTTDPNNQFYWRADTRRLDAEQIRDSMLAVSGQLKAEAGGESVLPDVPRRTIYTRVMRNSRDPLLDVFDLPLFFSSECLRNTTTTPIQSLMLINSPEMLRHAQAMAKQVSGGASTVTDQIAAAWRLAYGRDPSADELHSARQFVEQQQQRLSESPEATQAVNILTGRIPYRDGQAVALAPDSQQMQFAVADDERFALSDFTVEAYFQVRSIYDTGSVRTIVSKGRGDAGWAFGVTGKGSRRKPQTLVMQMWGTRRDGSFGEAAIFSDQHIELNKPYFAAATVKLAGSEPGVVSFYLKDLSNDDEPLHVATVEHEITGGLGNSAPLTIGGRNGDLSGLFDGLIDDVRITRGAMEEGQLLFTAESVADTTVGYWRFEPEPGVLHDSSPNGLHITADNRAGQSDDPALVALTDLCHALLNSNEFLYVK